MGDADAPKLTTWDKLQGLVGALVNTPPEQLGPETRDLGEMLQLARGIGYDPLAMFMPETPADADVMVDKLLTLLFALRGDDLPPFDPDRYGEAVFGTPGP